MTDDLPLTPTTRIHLVPTGLAVSPLDDPTAARVLAGGPVWFSGVVLVTRDGAGRRTASRHIPVNRVEDVLSGLDAPHQARAQAQWAALTSPRAPMALANGTVLRFDQPRVMGILNVTPDSFSDGGRYASADDAIGHAFSMATDGAALIDVGGESTRPGARPVWEGDEIARLEPVLGGLAAGGLAVSVDTRKAAVMRWAVGQGAVLVNDVSGLTHDPASLAAVAAMGVPVVVMHTQGDPESMQANPTYGDALLDVYDWLEARLAACVAAGIARERIILDPGIGFGKTLRHNLDLINGLALFHGLGCPLLAGLSRKRFVAALSREEGPEERLGGSLAGLLAALERGVQLHRVHDVKPAVQALKVWRGLRDGALTPAG